MSVTPSRGLYLYLRVLDIAMDDEIVTEISEIYNYSDAEDYHNDYYDNNPNQPYCVFVIKPKLDKLVEKGVIETK